MAADNKLDTNTVLMKLLLPRIEDALKGWPLNDSTENPVTFVLDPISDDVAKVLALKDAVLKVFVNAACVRVRATENCEIFVLLVRVIKACIEYVVAELIKVAGALRT